MIKKILGYLFYILGGLLTIGFIFGSIPNLISSFSLGDMAYTFGQLIGVFMIVIPIYLLFTYARKWTKKKPEKVDVKDIGKA